MAESFSLKAILSADGSQMSSTFSQIAGQVGGLQKTLMGGIGFGVMSSIGGKAVDLVSNGVKAMASTVMDSGMSFEAAGSQIAATMGKSKGEITDIINEASRLGATTSFTATQAAEGFNVLAMSGLNAKEQIATMSPVLDLAAAGSYDLSTAAEQVVGTVKGFGDSFDNAQKYADMFAKGATLASTDVNMLGRAMADSAANAASYGQEADRTCVALLRLAEQGVTGSEAATALSRAMADLYTATGPAQEELNKLGVKVYDDSGKARDFNTVIDELSSAMSGMSDEEKNAAANAIFSTYGLRAFNKMCVSSTDKVKEFEDGLRSATGSAADQAREQLNNLKGDVTIFGSAMEGLGVTIFSKLSPGFRSVVQGATEMISGMNASLEKGKLGTFVTNAGKYFSIFMRYAKQVGSAFGQAFSAIGKSLGKMNGSFGSLSSLTSFADVCSAVSNALVSLAGFIEAHSDTIAKLITLLPKVAGAFLAFRAVSFVAGIVTGIGGAFASLAGAIASGIGNKLSTVSSGMTEAGSSALQTSGPMLAAAKSFMMIGAGLALTAVAFALLAQSAIALAGAGGPAIAVMAGLVVAVAALSLGMMALVTHAAATSAQMTAAGTAFLMIGAAVL
ncbi:MAG: phage tail tape measure protein, partial [Lachnospiraceae bacterium]|nr:phage tail tape measure protein [Lachnospiraceae bacterium]